MPAWLLSFFFKMPLHPRGAKAESPSWRGHFFRILLALDSHFPPAHTLRPFPANMSETAEASSPSDYKYWAFISYSHQDNLPVRGDGSGDHTRGMN